MDSKKFIRHFRWWTLASFLLLFIVGIVSLALPTTQKLAFSVTVGVGLVLSAIPCIVAFFIGKDENPARLLASVAQLAVALWLFIDTLSSVYVFCVALAVIIALHVAAEVLDAVLSRKEMKKWWIVRIVLSACFLALAIVLPCDPFGVNGELLHYAGVVLLIFGLIYAVIALLISAFEKDEELKFKPVKKNKS